MRVAIAAQRGAHGARRRRLGPAEQLGQVIWLLAGRRLSDDFGGRRADPGQRLQGALPHQAVKLAGGQFADHLGRTPERPDPVGRRAGPLELEGNLPQCPERFHQSQRWEFSSLKISRSSGITQNSSPAGSLSTHQLCERNSRRAPSASSLAISASMSSVWMSTWIRA